jgi:hypothetical protein
MVVANWDEPISLDPLNINGSALPASDLIYHRLVMLGQDQTPKPWLAESWEATPDGTSYTLHLSRLLEGSAAPAPASAHRPDVGEQEHVSRRK